MGSSPPPSEDPDRLYAVELVDGRMATSGRRLIVGTAAEQRDRGPTLRGSKLVPLHPDSDPAGYLLVGDWWRASPSKTGAG